MSDTSAEAIYALTGSFLGLAAVIVGLRFWARSRSKAPYLIDDWLMLMSLVSFIGTSICVFLLLDMKAIGYSSFQFSTAEKIARYDRSTRIQTSFIATTISCLACTKASALFFYRRVFGVGGSGMRIFNRLVISFIVIIALWFVTFEVLTIFQCQGHFSGLWDPKKYAKYCTVTWQFLYGYSVSDVLLDIFVLALPIPIILRLHTNIAKKLSVLGIFMLGCVALGASIARLVIYVRIFKLGVGKYDKVDGEHISSQYGFYYVLECGCSILAINLPSVWPLFNGRSLESIMKLARSVTSLTSWGSDRSTTKESSTGKDVSPSPDSTYHRHKSISSVNTRDVSVPNGSIPSGQEIIRQDSVQISSVVRKPEQTYYFKEGC